MAAAGGTDQGLRANGVVILQDIRIAQCGCQDLKLSVCIEFVKSRRSKCINERYTQKKDPICSII